MCFVFRMWVDEKHVLPIAICQTFVSPKNGGGEYLHGPFSCPKSGGASPAPVNMPLKAI